VLAITLLFKLHVLKAPSIDESNHGSCGAFSMNSPQFTLLYSAFASPGVRATSKVARCCSLDAHHILQRKICKAGLYKILVLTSCSVKLAVV